MFFNVSREKSGRPGRAGDVMDVVWDVVGLSLPTHPRNLLHTEKLARIAKLMLQQDNVQARAFELRELSTKQQWRELGIDVVLERVTR